MTDSREEHRNQQGLRGEGTSHPNHRPLAPVYIRSSDANSVIASLNGAVESSNDVFTGVPQEVLDRDTCRMKYADAILRELEKQNEKQESDAKDKSESTDAQKGCPHSAGLIIPGLQIDTEEDDRLCEVCQCGYEDDEEVMVLPCQHFFHSECVGRWLSMKTTCPKCRHELSPPAPTEQREVIITRTTTIEWMPITQWVPASTTTVEVRSEVGSDYETVTTTTTRPVMIQGPSSLPQPPNGLNNVAPPNMNARPLPIPNSLPNVNGNLNPINPTNLQNPQSSNGFRPAPNNALNSQSSGPSSNIPVLTAAEYQRLLERANEALQQVQGDGSDASQSQAHQSSSAARIPVLTEEVYRRLLERANEALQQRNEDGSELPHTNTIPAGQGQTTSSIGSSSPGQSSNPASFGVLSQDYPRLDRVPEPLPSTQGNLHGTSWTPQSTSVGPTQRAWTSPVASSNHPANNAHRSTSIQSNAVIPMYGSPDWSNSSISLSSSAWHVLENMSPPTGPHPRIIASALNPNIPTVDSGSPTLQPIAAMGAIPVTPPLLPGGPILVPSMEIASSQVFTDVNPLIVLMQ
mmetsp:Transcript_36791/g.115011  ORF Transcript_36791/g.115011 Transcript_36791/m.115011 type:complete len:576 (-) Transcript_36791:1337-3064(-)